MVTLLIIEQVAPTIAAVGKVTLEIKASTCVCCVVCVVCDACVVLCVYVYVYV